MLAVIGAWVVFDPPAPREAGAFSSQPPAAKTGAPGETTCLDCHVGGPLNDGVGSVTIGSVPTSYTPGQTYTLTVAVVRTGMSRWGFELVPLKNSDNSMAGSFTNTTQLTATQTLNSKIYISHSSLITGQDGTFRGVVTGGNWTFSWIAPAAGAGAVTFYAAGNAANNSGTNAGDRIYTTMISATEGATTDVDATTWGKIKMLYR